MNAKKAITFFIYGEHQNCISYLTETFSHEFDYISQLFEFHILTYIHLLSFWLYSIMFVYHTIIEYFIPIIQSCGESIIEYTFRYNELKQITVLFDSNHARVSHILVIILFWLWRRSQYFHSDILVDRYLGNNQSFTESFINKDTRWTLLSHRLQHHRSINDII